MGVNYVYPNSYLPTWGTASGCCLKHAAEPLVVVGDGTGDKRADFWVRRMCPLPPAWSGCLGYEARRPEITP